MNSNPNSIKKKKKTYGIYDTIYASLFIVQCSINKVLVREIANTKAVNPKEEEN